MSHQLEMWARAKKLLAIKQKSLIKILTRKFFFSKRLIMSKARLLRFFSNFGFSVSLNGTKHGFLGAQFIRLVKTLACSLSKGYLNELLPKIKVRTS